MGNVILGLLMLLGPQTLYSLNTQFQRGPSLFYRASFGSLQSALRGLVASGYVTVREATESGRNKKIHTITDEGVSAFHDWIRSPLAGGDLEVAALSRLFLLGLVDDPDERRDILDHIVAEVDRELARLEEFAAALDEQVGAVPEEYRDVFHYQRATLDYGLMAHRAGLAWFRDLADATSHREPGAFSGTPEARADHES